MMRIAIVVGTTRPGRRALDVAQWVHRHAWQADARFEVVDLADQGLPLLDEPVPPSLGDYRQDHTRRWSEVIASYDGFVFVTPEYNHGIPAALKNALDFLYQEWNDKAAGVVAYGVDGGTRAVEQLRLVLGELRVADVRSQVSLSLFDDFGDTAGPTPREHQELALHAMLDQLVGWSGALRGLRAAASEPVPR